MLGCLFFRGDLQKDETRSVGESCLVLLAGPEHEASTSAAPALDEMTLLVGPNSNLPAFKDRRDTFNAYCTCNR